MAALSFHGILPVCTSVCVQISPISNKDSTIGLGARPALVEPHLNYLHLLRP